MEMIGNIIVPKTTSIANKTANTVFMFRFVYLFNCLKTLFIYLL